MNTDKTLRQMFIDNSNKEYPIWYYKEIKPVSIDYVVFNLLKETFVVKLNNKKVVITFGKNKNNEIGSSQSCDEGLDYTSFECINKAFKNGEWYRITENDTTQDFKDDYIKKRKKKAHFK